VPLIRRDTPFSYSWEGCSTFCRWVARPSG